MTKARCICGARIKASVESCEECGVPYSMRAAPSREARPEPIRRPPPATAVTATEKAQALLQLPLCEHVTGPGDMCAPCLAQVRILREQFYSHLDVISSRIQRAEPETCMATPRSHPRNGR